MAKTKGKTASRNGAAHKPAAAPESTHPLARCRPRGDRVVVRRDVQPKQIGNILIPDSVQMTRQQLGTVHSAGPGGYDKDGNRIEMPKVGDRVIITGYAGLEIRDPANAGNSEDEFVLLREEDVLATLPSENDDYSGTTEE